MDTEKPAVTDLPHDRWIRSYTIGVVAFFAGCMAVSVFLALWAHAGGPVSFALVVFPYAAGTAVILSLPIVLTGYLVIRALGRRSVPKTPAE